MRSVTEIKSHIGYSWNKVYEERSFLSFDWKSRQGLVVYFGIWISFFGQSLHKNYPIVKRGFQCILLFHRQWLVTLPPSKVFWEHCWLCSVQGLHVLRFRWGVSFWKWIRAFWHDRRVPGEKNAFRVLEYNLSSISCTSFWIPSKNHILPVYTYSLLWFAQDMRRR